MMLDSIIMTNKNNNEPFLCISLWQNVMTAIIGNVWETHTLSCWGFVVQIGLIFLKGKMAN